MMRYLVSAAFVACLAVAAYLVMAPVEESVPSLSVAVPIPAMIDEVEVDHRPVSQGEITGREPAAAQQPKAAAKPTAEQRAAAQQQETRLKQMARDYEELRSDPEQRAAHRELMKAELAAYNENILPIVLEQAESAVPPSSYP